MKRRIFAFVLCLSMVLSLAATGMPVHAETVDCTCGATAGEGEELVHTPECAINNPPQEQQEEPPVSPACDVEGCKGADCDNAECSCENIEHHPAPVDNTPKCICTVNEDGTKTYNPECTVCEKPEDNTPECICTVNDDGSKTYVDGCPVCEAPVDTEQKCDYENCSDQCTVEGCPCKCHKTEEPAVDKCDQCGAEADADGNIAHKADCPTNCSCGFADGNHTEGCPLYVPTEPAFTHAEGCTGEGCTVEGCKCQCHCDCEHVDGKHDKDCPLYEEPQCDCGAEPGQPHAESCPLNPSYGLAGDRPGFGGPDMGMPEVKATPKCTCDSTDGNHTAACELNAHPISKGSRIELVLHPGDVVGFFFPDVKNTPSSVQANKGDEKVKNWTWGTDYGLLNGNSIIFTVPDVAQPGDVYTLVAAWGIFKPTYSDIATITVAEAEPVDMNGSITLADGETTVFVSGKKPAGTELSVNQVDVNEALDTTVYGVNENHVAFDISLTDGAQPEGDVNLTVDSAKLGLTPGDEFLVYHVHNGETELLGPYEADENGNANFTVSGFSYCIVMNSTLKVDNIDSFYKVSGTSNNDHHHILGVYFKGTEAHILLGSDNKSSLKDPQSASINGVPVSNVLFEIFGEATELQLKDDKGNIINQNLLQNDPDHSYIWDINLGTGFEVTGSFNLTVTMKNGDGGHGIDNVPVTVFLNYNIQKFVYQVNSGAVTENQPDPEPIVEVKQGDTVIYKIVVTNPILTGDTNNISVLGATITDVLPSNIFDTTNVMVSANGTDFEKVTQVNADNSFEIGTESINVGPGVSVSHYVKATVKSDADVGIYTNTAKLSGGNVKIEDSDTAGVEIKLPPTGSLKISKTVTSNDPTIPVPANIDFTFQVFLVGAPADAEYQYQVYDSEDTEVGDPQTFNGTITLQAGQYAKFDALPAGVQYTVTETNIPVYFQCTTPTADIEGNHTISGTVESNATKAADFVNQYVVPGSLEITKTVETNYDEFGPKAPIVSFPFTFTVQSEADLAETEKNTYKLTIFDKDGKAQGDEISIKSGSLFSLRDGDRAVITGIPAGETCIVAENELTDGLHKNFSRVDESLTAVIETGKKAQLSFTNIYSLYNLTITKTCDVLEENQSFVFNVTGPDGYAQTVVIHGNGSATIKYLPAGDYNITEETGWSWRYSLKGGGGKVTLGGENADMTAVAPFSNQYTNNKWLSGSNWRDNLWTDGSSNQGTRHDGQ